MSFEEFVRLSFVYVPVPDLAAAVVFDRDTLGLVETWREGSDTVAFALPGADTELMVSVSTHQPAGPMYEVDDVTGWLAGHPTIQVVVDRYAIPGGSVAGLADLTGNTFYVFDQHRPS